MFVLHDMSYLRTDAIIASNRRNVRDQCNRDECYIECRYSWDQECLSCVDQCESDRDQICSSADKDFYTCLYKTEKPALIAGAVMFSINFLIGIVVLIMFAKLPRDPCCYPNYTLQKTPLQVVQSNSAELQIVQLPNGQQVLVQPQMVTQSQQMAATAPPSYQEVSKDGSNPTTL